MPTTIMKSDRLLWLAFVLFLSSLSAQGAAAINQPPPVLRTTFTIVENRTENETVGQLVQYDGEDFRFSVESTVCSQFFIINSTTSSIRTVGMLDREAIYREMETDQPQCFVQYYNTTAGINATVPITIYILDVNDEVPQFSNLIQPHIVQVVENLAAPTPLLRLEPIDDDSGANGTVQFSIISGDTSYFRIMKAEGDTSDTTTRLLFLQRELDFEVLHNRRFNLTIRISDMGSPLNHVFDQQIVIIVNNTLDEPPTFPTSRFVFQIPENYPVGITHPFANVTAANPHEVLGSIFYYLCEESGCERSGPVGVILVNEVTGGLYLNQSLDFDDNSATSEYRFYVKASNPATGTSQNAFVQVVVEDVNDNAPYFTCHKNSPLPCPPNSPSNPHFTRMNISTGENSLTDMRRLLLVPNDDDRSVVNSAVNYIVSSKPQINITSGNIGTVLFFLGITQMLDREVTPNITISLTIFNIASPQLSSTAVISIHVEDLNDNTPTFTQTVYNTYVSEGSPTGKEIVRVEALDSDADKNGEVNYTITAVDKPAARSWFQISATTGVISVTVDNIDYHTVQGVVVLHVTATDNGEEPLSSTAIVQVEIVPAITFSGRSYQAFANYNLAAAQGLDSVYLEFQTSSSVTEGVLLHHQGESGRFSLGLEGRRVVLRRGEEVTLTDDVSIAGYSWYSVFVQRSGQDFRLNVWRTESQDADSVLLGVLIQNCSSGTENKLVNSEQLLFIGGSNQLSPINGVSPQSDFIGAIRNIVIGQSQVNLRCPQEQENTIIGVQRSDGCRNEELSCSPIHSTGCVDYARESFCRCKGGFASEICYGSADSYAPIRLHGNGHMTLNLPYSFFHDLKVLKETESEGNVPDSKRRRRRKRRQVNDSMTLQKVDITFRPVEVGASVLLHSESQRYIHQLMINEYAIAYQVFDKTDSTAEPRDQVLISNFDILNGTEYSVSITYNSVDTTMAITSNMISQYNNDAWDTNPITLFAEQPETSLSIGGAPGGRYLFAGCITSLKIDGINFPLSGLASLSAEEGGFTYNTSDTVVEPYCNLCDLATCPSNMTCVSDNYGGTNCACPEGYVLDEIDNCRAIVDPSVGPVLTEAVSGQSIYYIAGGTGGGILFIGAMIVVLIVVMRLQHVKHDKRKRTYSVTSMTSNGILPPQRTSKSGNDYVRVEPRKSGNDSDSLAALGQTCRPDSHERGSSVSTFQEHAEDADPEIDEPPRLQRRKSTVSAESGIRTDTERDSSVRGTSRMDDSGTDYTPQESESDDMTSSCFMEPVSSPVGMHLVDSASSVMGVPVKVASPCVPLTPQERKVITPLRPDSICLSIGDDHRDTDTETDLSSCNLQPIRQNCPMQRESDSDASTRVSDRSTPKWYKSSTASDNERESERAHKNTAYYPTRSEPMQYPHPSCPKTSFSAAAPDYIPPPSISARKSASPVFPRSPTRRFPPTMVSANSLLTKNTRKYENYPLPYNMPHHSDDVLGRGTGGAMHSYENHRLQHQISAPQEHHGGQQGRRVYFANSSQTLHYSRSVGNGTYTPQKQQMSHPANSRQYYNTLSSGIPTSLQYRPNRSYSSSDAPPPDREPTQFQDLKNVSTINPITYWETQDRLKPAVDQVDPYQVLSEPYIQFEDVSTDLSVTESQGTLHAEDEADHEVFESQGGGEGTADMGPGCLARFEDHDMVSLATTDSQSIQGGGITHFPSADCSSEYTATINGTSSSGDSTPKFQPTNGILFPSQQSFDV